MGTIPSNNYISKIMVDIQHESVYKVCIDRNKEVLL